MTDYSKPTGWWCPRHRGAPLVEDTPTTGDICWRCSEVCIPVFTPLPVPEPGADEPDDDTVCTFSDGDHPWVGVDPCFISGVWARAAWIRRDLAARSVLWVAEGTLP